MFKTQIDCRMTESQSDSFTITIQKRHDLSSTHCTLICKKHFILPGRTQKCLSVLFITHKITHDIDENDVLIG